MIDWNKPIQTRDGRKARMICDDLRYGSNLCEPTWKEHTYVCLVSDEDNIESIHVYTRDGIFCSGIKYPLDIINVPEEPKEHAGWINIYDSSEINPYIYETREDAEKRNKMIFGKEFGWTDNFLYFILTLAIVFVILAIIVISVLPPAEGTYYATQKSLSQARIDHIINSLPKEYFDGLDVLYFTNQTGDNCTGNGSRCLGLFLYDKAEGDGIITYVTHRQIIIYREAYYNSNFELNCTLMHELGHLKESKSYVGKKESEIGETFALQFERDHGCTG